MDHVLDFGHDAPCQRQILKIAGHFGSYLGSLVDVVSSSSSEFLAAGVLVVKECFYSADKNNSFFEDDPPNNEKIALYFVGSTTASFEVGTAQCYFLVYKPRKCFMLLENYI